MPQSSLREMVSGLDHTPLDISTTVVENEKQKTEHTKEKSNGKEYLS